jgi:ribosomal protein S18 acetylase RimI-like enzyme
VAGARDRLGSRSDLVERARELGSALALDVFKSNLRAVQLHESLGFVRAGESETDVFVRLEPKL